MINRANEEAEKNIIKTNNDFHNFMEVKKKNTDMKIKQMREQAIRDIKNASINIGFKAVERLMSKSLDKSKLDKLYNESVEETKLALKKNSS